MDAIAVPGGVPTVVGFWRVLIGRLAYFFETIRVLGGVAPADAEATIEAFPRQNTMSLGRACRRYWVGYSKSKHVTPAGARVSASVRLSWVYLPNHFLSQPKAPLVSSSSSAEI